MELFPLQDLCNGFHFPNAELEQKRAGVKRTLGLLDKERRLVMANYAEMNQLLESLNVRYAELEARSNALRAETIQVTSRFHSSCESGL